MIHLAEGMRAELAPHTDQFMRGLRYGEVVTVSGDCVTLRMDRTGGLLRAPRSAIRKGWYV